MNILQKAILFLAALGCLGTLSSCSTFKKKDEDDGLTRWNESEGKPSRFARWKAWEKREADEMWQKFRDS